MFNLLKTKLSDHQNLQLAQTRDWKKYLNANTPGLRDCQLVTAINAYYFFYGKTILQDSKRYKRFLEDTKAATGDSCINIDKVYSELGLKRVAGPKILMDSNIDNLDSELAPSLPFELSIFHKHYGIHSVLVVDYEPRTESLRVPNFFVETSTKGWIYVDDIQHFAQHIHDPESGTKMRCRQIEKE